jgi:two-component system cell cycle sensor histidine kinase/response regulator CckA
MPTVLVVDDEPAIRSLVARVLEQEGLSVIRAADGRQALSLSQGSDEHIDLLISDVVMPEMDGPTLARNLVAKIPELPVLFISGCCDSMQFEGCRPFAFLPKPLDIPSLLKTVEALLTKTVASLTP